MLQLRPECVEPLQNFIKHEKSDKNKTVTCTFDTNMQFEELDETCLLPKDVMHIVYEYFDDKVIVNCNYYNCYTAFNINDNDNKIVYYYSSIHNILIVPREKFNQKDDSIMIISSSISYFNLSRLYYHYAQDNDLTFDSYAVESTATNDDNKYTITVTPYGIIYKSVVLNHEILQRRLIVMKQLIDIIKKICPFSTCMLD